jgi:hypothetical protein
MKCVLKIVMGFVLSAGLAVGFYGLMGERGAPAQTEKKGASPSGFDARVRNDAERMIQEGQETTQPSDR